MAQNIAVFGMAGICRSAAYAALGAAAGLAMASSAHAASAAKGKDVFQSQCAACHSAQKGDNGIGPSLYGVYGSHAASVPGYNFSSALKSSKIVWNQKTLDKFLANPQGYVTGTKMTYPGLPSASKRADVIAYLKTLGGNGAGK
jgi:cytochrome c